MGRPRGTAKNREAASTQAAAAGQSSKEPEPPAQDNNTVATVQMPSPSPSLASTQLPSQLQQDTLTAGIIDSPMPDFVNNPNQSTVFDVDMLVPFLAPSQSISTEAPTTCMDDNALTASASIIDFIGGNESLPDWTTDTHAQPTLDHDPMLATNDSANNIASSTLMDNPFALDLGADLQIANSASSKDADDARGGCAAALVRQTSTEVTNAAKEQAHEAKSIPAVLGSCEKVLGQLASPCNCGRCCSTRISMTLAGCYAARALGEELTAGMARCGGAQGTVAGEDGSIGTDATTAFAAITTGTRLRFGSYSMEMPHELVSDLFMRRWRLLQAKVEELNELNYLECMDRPLGSPCEEIRDCVLAELRVSLARGVIQA